VWGGRVLTQQRERDYIPEKGMNENWERKERAWMKRKEATGKGCTSGVKCFLTFLKGYHYFRV
jgi:hypothetical protein